MSQSSTWVSIRRFAGFATVLAIGLATLPSLSAEEGRPEQVYRNRLTPIADPQPLLADHPEFVEPIREPARFQAPPLIEDPNADLSVRAWRYSYNARGIIEMPNRLLGERTAVIAVHPWGIDDGQGWRTPQPAGVAFFCTPEKNHLSRRHARTVLNPFLKAMRDRVGLVMYSLPGKEDPIRNKLYRSIRHRTTAEARKAGQAELKKTLNAFTYQGRALPETFTVSQQHPTADYFRNVPGLDAGAAYDNSGFWNLPIPVVSDVEVGLNDVVMYDGDGYPALKRYLQEQGIQHVLLTGYATDMCVCSTTAGYENLTQDFNVFLVGDATLATFPAQATPRFATTAAIAKASLNVLITQTSWVKPVTQNPVAERP